MTTELTCQDRVKTHLKSRISDLGLLFRSWQDGEEGTVKDTDGQEIGNFNEYGLCFDYVAPGTFNNQKRGYFRYQLSTGGPGDEFRFYTDENLNPTRIEYWFLDWFDGAKINLKGKDKALMLEIWESFKECEVVDSAFKKAMED
jgi:hypothetical protein